MTAYLEARGIALSIVKRPRRYGRFPDDIKDIPAYLKSKGIEVKTGFQVLPRRWVVERTFAWISRYRRMSKDYEYLCETSVHFLFLIMSKLMLKRLTN